MKHGKIFALLGMAILGGSLFGILSFWGTSSAQTSGPRLLQVADIDSVNGMQTSNPLANYLAGNAQYPGQEVSFDNEGISIFIMPTTQQTAITTDGAISECGHLGIQEWKGANYAYKLTDANTWQKRSSTCAGYVVIGSSGQIREQTLTIKGTSVEGKPFTLQVNVPHPSSWDNEVGGGSRRLYISDTGGVYACKSLTYRGAWPNECEFSPQAAMQMSPVSTGMGAVCGNNLCQYGETYASCSADCPPPPPTCTLTLNDNRTSYPSDSTTFVNYTYTCSSATTVAVQVVKPDGIATTYNTGTNITTSTMGFGTSNLTAGSYTLRICVNDTACSPSSLVSVPFTITAPVTVACTGVNLSTNKTSYSAGENVTFNYSCASPSNGALSSLIIQVIPPNGTTSSVMNVTTVTPSSGTNITLPGTYSIPASFFTATGSYMIRTCMNSNCSLLNSVMVNYTSGTSTTTTTAACTKLAITTDKTSYTRGENVNYVFSCATPVGAAAANGTVKLVRPDGVTSTYITVAGSSVLSHGYGFPVATEFPVGAYTLKVCMDSACTAASAGVATFTVVAGTTTTTTGTNTTTPAAPTNVNAVALSNDSVTITWTDVASNERGYHIFRRLINTTVWTESISGIAANLTSYTNIGVPAGTYEYKVNAYIIDGDNWIYSPDSNLATTTVGVTSSVGTTTTTGAITNTTSTTPGVCENGQTCASGSWCQNGSMCYYPDSRITCVAWPANTMSAMSPGMMSSPSCPAGTTVCNPTEPNCVNPGQTVPYMSSKWCMNAQSYYSSDGRNMTCVKNGDSAPAGYSNCRPDDANCIATGAYGSSNGYCSQGMKCYQKATDNNSRNDNYCAPTPYGTAATPAEVTCPSGYSVCSVGDEFCKTKGDKWTNTSNAYYCMMSQKCNVSSGGGVCIGWSESCPSGTKYCNSGDTNCIEPGEYKTTDGSSMSYWCGGGGGMTFYSKTKAYCAPRKANDTMWAATDIKAALERLGSGWGICRPNETNCIEPGQTGSSAGWCAWMPAGTYSSNEIHGSTKTCPSLDGTSVTTTTTPGSPVTPVTTPVVLTTPPPFNEMRECAPGEMPNANNYCRMPMYHWNISAKIFEKCSQSDMTAYTSTAAADSAKRKYTNCESMNLEIEKEWRTERYMVHPPELDGDWYMPPWDAASPMLQYNAESDKMEGCKTTAVAMSTTYIAPCMPVPEKDRSWMLKKFRAEYKVYLTYKSQSGNATSIGIENIQATPFTTQLPQAPMPQLQAAQCKPYLLGIKQGLNADKKFWKDTASQFSTVPSSYPDYETVKKLLGDSKTVILDLDKLMKGSKCDTEQIGAIKSKLDMLHTDIFSELSAYTSDIESYVEYGMCRNDLTAKQAQLSGLLKNGINPEEKQSIKDLVANIDEKIKELNEKVGEFDYDAGFECREFGAELGSQMATLIRTNDEELNRIIDDVVSRKLEPALANLSAQLEERGKKIDELLVKVAELHKAIEGISQAATQISEQIAISYTALSRIDEKYSEVKQEMQSVKEELLPRVQEAMNMIKTTDCVRGGELDRIISKFGSAASINWFGERADEMNKRINLFVSSCKGGAMTADDVNVFMKSVDDASSQNLKDSYAKGLTPYPDVPTHEWYYGAMVTANNTGAMTQGRPGENVLRQDALLMILRATGSTDADLIGECDVSRTGIGAVSPYAACAVKTAMAKGVYLTGSLQTPVSRIEIAEWLKKLTNLESASDPNVLKPYSDLGGLSSVERDAVSAVVSAKVMVGNISGTTANFTPRAPLTRAALAVILEQVLNLKQ